LPKIGLMGGTFDPVHLGHLQLAVEAQRKLALDKVLFIPAGQPWMKSDRPLTPASHRLQMLKLATRNYPGFEVSRLEIARPGLTYTIDTLRQLTQADKGKTTYYLILSWNTLAELPGWKEPEAIVRLCYLVAAPRPGYRQPDVAALEAKIKGITPKIVWLDSPRLNISSTAVRERVKMGQAIDAMVPAEVAAYISKEGLYR